MEKHKKFLYIGVFWLVLIILFIGSKEFTLRTGNEILLKTAPVDPRDLFRGDYVTLRYEINSLNLSEMGVDASAFMTGEDVYVALNTINNCAVPAGVYKEAPNNTPFIKGKIKNILGNNLMVEYGIESYFVPEKSGRDIEELDEDELVVKTAVDSYGNAAIKELLIKGNECN